MTAKHADRTLTASDLRTALIIFKVRKAQTIRMFESAAEDAAQDRRDGHRAHYCVHGMNLWTDYDPICGPCEDGLTSVADYLPILRERAIADARRFRADLDDIVKMNNTATRLSITFDVGEALDQLMAHYGIPRS